jgi:hypothetical protein
MKILSQYNFLNDKTIRVVYHSDSELKKKKMPVCDAFSLEFVTKGEVTGFGLRPDEMAIIIRLLSDALFKGIKTYHIGLLRGYNGFDKKK